MCWRQFTKGCRAVSSHLLGLSADTRTQTVTVIGFMRLFVASCVDMSGEAADVLGHVAANLNAAVYL